MFVFKGFTGCFDPGVVLKKDNTIGINADTTYTCVTAENAGWIRLEAVRSAEIIV